MNILAGVVCSLSLALAVGVAPSSAAAPQKPSAVKTAPSTFFPSDAELERLLNALVAHGEAKGIVLGLLEPNGTRRIIAHGDAGAGVRPLDHRSAFEIGSISKTFTGTLLAEMVMRGEVKLDDPISSYLPAGVKVPSKNGREITLIDLATHTSGLPRVPTGYKIPDRSNPYAHYQAQDLYGFLSTYELAHEIGSKPQYSNLGMGLLGHVLARAAGKSSFAQLVKERITRPLGMNMTAYGRAGPVGKLMVKGHDLKGEQVPYWDVAVLAGAGGLNAHAWDMLTYLDANTGAASSPLEQAMRRAHQAQREIKPGLSIGLGWQIRTDGKKSIVHHGGGTAGFQTHIGFDPATGAGVVIMGNSAGFELRDDVVFNLISGRDSLPLPSQPPRN